jgi:hypothetical protein
MAARARPERDLLPVQRRNICCQEPEIPTGRNFPWRPSVFRRCCGQQGVAQVLAQRGRAAATSPLPERVPHRWLDTVALQGASHRSIETAYRKLMNSRLSRWFPQGVTSIPEYLLG